jgi:hypothetical protein
MSGFYLLQLPSGLEVLSYSCDKCHEAYRDIPRNGTIFCCGRNIPVPEKVTRRERYERPGSGAVDLSGPVKIAGRILGIV